jgi:uncharacterized membrane protein
MEKNDMLVVKYKALVSEWNTISLVSSILFGSAIIGFLMSLIYLNFLVTFIAVALMLIFAAFEHRSRTLYVKEKLELEKQLFKSAGLKNKGIVNKGLIW